LPNGTRVETAVRRRLFSALAVLAVLVA